MTSDKPIPMTPSGHVTQISGSLPTVDVDIQCHEDREIGEETVTITVRARPGFEAMAQALLPCLLPTANLFSAASLFPGMAVGPSSAQTTFLGPMAALAGMANTSAPDRNADLSSVWGLWQSMMAQAWGPAMSSLGAPWMTAWQDSATSWAEMMRQMSGVPLCSGK